GPISPDESQSQEQKLQSMISALWERSRHTVVERAARLRTAGDLLSDNRLDHATQQSAVDSDLKLQSMISALWERSRHTVVERAARLRTAGDLLSDNRLDHATQQSAVD